jgi:multiple sugar transport system permease protein
MEDARTTVLVVNKKERIRDNIRRNRLCYLLIAPFFILFFIFTVLPVISSVVLGFTYYNILQPPEFVGLKNYAKMFFADDIFMKSFVNTLVIASIIGPIGYIGALLLAWMINELSRLLRTLLILFIYIPSITANMYLVWTIILSGDDYGYLNAWLLRVGFIKESIQWFHDTRYMMAAIIVISLWMSMGAGFLAFSAGLSGIDRNLYEAGMIDGIKNRWQELWFITLPQMKPQLLFGAIMSITAAFAVGDITITLCGNPSIDYAAHTILNHLTDYGTTRFDMGYASAISTVLFLFMFLSSRLIRRILKNVGN